MGPAIDPSGTWLVSLQGGRVRKQRLDSLPVPPQTLGTYTGDVALHAGPWRDRAVVSDSNGEVRIWDLPSGRLLRTLSSPTDARPVALDDDGRFLATCPRVLSPLPPRSMFLFDLAAPRGAEPMPLLESDADFLGESLLFSPDGSWLASDHLGTAILWNVTGPYSVVLAREEFPAVAFADDGQLLTGGNEGVLRRWPLDPETAEEVAEVWSRPGARIGWMAQAPQGGSVAVRDSGGYGRVVVVPLDGSGEPITEPERSPEPPDGHVNADWFAWDPSGGELALFEHSWVRPEVGGMRVIDLATGLRRSRCVG